MSARGCALHSAYVPNFLLFYHHVAYRSNKWRPRATFGWREDETHAESAFSTAVCPSAPFGRVADDGMSPTLRRITSAWRRSDAM